MKKQIKALLKNLENRSTCLSRHVGAIITTKDDYILGLGYNGAPIILEDCKSKGECIRKLHNIKSGECLDMCRAVHAEERALLDLDKDDEIYRLYVSCMPCARCTKLLIERGIKEIVAQTDYNSEYTKQLLKEAKVKYKILGGKNEKEKR